MNYLKRSLNDMISIYKLNANNFNCKLLYHHFAHDHDLDVDLRFQIFVSNFTDFRKRLETDLMDVLNSIQPTGLSSSPSFLLNCIENYQKPPLITEKI